MAGIRRMLLAATLLQAALVQCVPVPSRQERSVDSVKTNTDSLKIAMDDTDTLDTDRKERKLGRKPLYGKPMTEADLQKWRRKGVDINALRAMLAAMNSKKPSPDYFLKGGHEVPFKINGYTAPPSASRRALRQQPIDVHIESPEEGRQIFGHTSYGLPRPPPPPPALGLMPPLLDPPRPRPSLLSQLFPRSPNPSFSTSSSQGSYDYHTPSQRQQGGRSESAVGEEELTAEKVASEHVYEELRKLSLDEDSDPTDPMRDVFWNANNLFKALDDFRRLRGEPPPSWERSSKHIAQLGEMPATAAAAA